MKRIFKLTSIVCFILSYNQATYSAPCAFDAKKDCKLQRDILNDIGSNNLRYYAPTNYDHRMSGEINVYDATLTVPYTDSANKPGQLKFIGNKINSGFWKSGEIMTRHDLHYPPWNAPVKSNRWTTQEAKHGYLEVVVKMPGCVESSDGVCQKGNPPNNYSDGLWPAIWLEPTMDAHWPQDGEIDISEAYYRGSDYKTSTAALHFNGHDSSCSGGDCVGPGYPLPSSKASRQLWYDFHTWGFEWEVDPKSSNGGQLLNAYFDNVKVWTLRTDTLPADGPNALRRGFNNPDGGYYLIVNLAIGGPYAGAPNSQLTKSVMYLQSAKAYVVDGGSPTPPEKTCKPPVNIQSMYSSDKKQITIAWSEPPDTLPIKQYLVADWNKKVLWRGADAKDRVFQDQTLPGTKGTFTYYLQTVCETKNSDYVQHNVVIPIKNDARKLKNK